MERWFTPSQVSSRLRGLADYTESDSSPRKSVVLSSIRNLLGAIDSTALPKDWRLITDKQIGLVMKAMPPGSKIYGSYANQKAGPGSDLDVKLPENIGEKQLEKLMVKTMRDLDLNIGSLNISMPCEEHEDCSVLAHTDEAHLIPPLIEHLKGGIKDDESLPEDKKKQRDSKRKTFEKFIKEAESDLHFRLTEDDKEMIEKLLNDVPTDQIIQELLAKHQPAT